MEQQTLHRPELLQEPTQRSQIPDAADDAFVAAVRTG